MFIIGVEPELERFRRRAGENVELLGFQPFNGMRNYIHSARAFIITAIEDFGIAMLESQASGTPVIARSKGSTLETIIEGKTGLFLGSNTREHSMRNTDFRGIRTIFQGNRDAPER